LTGVVYGELRLFEQAELCFNQGMKISEDKTRFLYSKGVLYLFQGKLDLAIECFKSAILIQPNFSPALNNLGVCTAIMNDHVEAINIFNRSLDSSPTDVSRANAYSNKAISLSYLNDKNGANASLDAAIKIQPDDINNLITKGRIQLFQNKYKLALRTAKQIQSKQIEKDSYPLDAVSKIALGDFQDATSRFHLWLNQKPLPFLRLIVLSDLTYLQRKSKFGEEIQSIISIISAYADK
jgi:tetratricopeptide (TPR) repeat protein